jgi:hypothetical protein
MYRRFFILFAVLLVLFACDKNTKPKYDVATPTFTPGAGTFSSQQLVQIQCNTDGATLRYTLDGTDPNTNSAIYSTPLHISSYTEIRVRGYKKDMNPSAMTTGIYSFNVAKPIIYPRGGTNMVPIKVGIISFSPGNVIHYTTDGSNPTETSPTYTDSLLLDGNTLLKARGYISGWIPSDIDSVNFVFNVANPTLNFIGGTYYTELSLTMNTPTSNALIYYTTDGSVPTESSILYTESINVDTTTHLKVRAYKTNWNPSATIAADYLMKATAVTFNPLPGTSSIPQAVTLNTTTPGADIYYTTNGGVPSVNANLYTGPINLATNTTLKASAFRDGWTPSNISTGVYNFKVATPTFSLPSGLYTGAQVVTITCTTPDSEIRYTNNNSDPLATSTLYTGPLNVTESHNYKAKAFRLGWTSSEIGSASYQISNVVASPVFSPDPGVIYTEPLEVILTCATTGAFIYYTLDHTPPSIISTQYTIYPIQVSENTEIRAIALKDGMTPSPIVVAFYQVSHTVATPTFSPDPGVLYYTPQYVTIECETAQADIMYTTDGAEPDETSSLYSDPIYISSSTQIKARAFREDWTPSASATAQYQIESTNQILGWGLNDSGQCNVPMGSGFIQIDAGASHTVALRSNGTLAAWGNNDHQQCNFPTGETYVAVSAGTNHSLALTSGNQVVAWGDNTDGQCTVPVLPGVTFQAISAGGNHSLALTSDNTLVAWGSNSDGQCSVPAGTNFIKISAGTNFNLALRSTGGIVAWGNNDSGQLNAPSDNIFMDIASGDQHCIAKRNNGTLIAWGNNTDGQATAPLGSNFAFLSAGKRHNIALRTDGTIVTWGYSGNGLSNVPTGSGFIEVSAGEDFSIALQPNVRYKGKVNLKNLKPRFKLK